MKTVFPLYFILFVFLAACNQDEKKIAGNDNLQQEAQRYLDAYNSKYQELSTASYEGQWVLNTHIVPGDSTASKAAASADEALAKFTGSTANIDSAKKYLASKDQLTGLQVKQFIYILFFAGNNPETAGNLVKQRIDASNAQVEKLYSFNFVLNGKKVSTNNIDALLRESNSLQERNAAWTASKEVGKTLKDGLHQLQQLRNGCVKPLGFPDYFAYQVSEYGMTTDEMMGLTQGFIKDVWPLYRELHTWARYELAKKYKQPVPEFIPADWLPNRWGQEWTALMEVEGLNIDPALKKNGPEWIMRKGEEFWTSLGFSKLPQSFWDKSSLYPLPDNSGFSKNNHASAWHIDTDKDVRSLMSVEPNTEWWTTVLHELGHIYYSMEYSTPNVPIVLRTGANRGYHEAFGSMIGLASLQKPLLESQGLIAPGVKTNDTLKLLNEALDYIVHIPWGSGVMTAFEHELYSKNLPKDQYNSKWWELVKKYQGIVPPADRKDADGYCDAVTKTHINDDAAQYYDYSISNVLLFQVHDHIAKKILKQDPHATNYWGSKATGDFLRKVMQPGATVDWKEHLQNSIGSNMSAKPMVDYFAPLMAYLKRQNTGRTYTLTEVL
jgi:peptidyl-dipeptidase A